jgi:hypothetical protein
MIFTGDLVNTTAGENAYPENINQVLKLEKKYS